MNLLENALSWANLSFVVVLCVFVFTRRVQRILPLFTVYACALLTAMIGVWLIYDHFGFYSPISYYAYWGSVLMDATARSLAIAELCHYGLRVYRGIWGLIWRVLASLSILLLARAAVDAWGQPNQFAIYGMTIDRDLDLASIVILAVLLIFRNYYGISFNPLQRAIAVGICIICIVDVIGNTVLRNIFTGYLFSWFLVSQKALWPTMAGQVRRVNDIWATIHLCFVMFSMGIWCVALRKPLPEPAAAPELLPVEIYRDLSPAINMRLATFNDRMLELLEP